MRTVKLCTLLLITALLSACNTTPYDKATIFYDRTQFPAQLAQDHPEMVDPIIQHGRCTIIITTPGSNTGSYQFCTYSLTASAIDVQGWDAKTMKYVEIAHVEISKLKKISMASYIRATQVQLTEERRQLALSAVIDEGGYGDNAATERLFETLKGKGILVVKSEGMINPPAPPSPVIIPIVLPR